MSPSDICDSFLPTGDRFERKHHEDDGDGTDICVCWKLFFLLKRSWNFNKQRERGNNFVKTAVFRTGYWKKGKRSTFLLWILNQCLHSETFISVVIRLKDIFPNVKTCHAVFLQWLFKETKWFYWQLQHVISFSSFWIEMNWNDYIATFCSKVGKNSQIWRKIKRDGERKREYGKEELQREAGQQCHERDERHELEYWPWWTLDQVMDHLMDHLWSPPSTAALGWVVGLWV